MSDLREKIAAVVAEFTYGGHPDEAAECLLALIRKADPVMPEAPSAAVISAYNNTTFYPEVSAQQAYQAFRDALMKEQAGE